MSDGVDGYGVGQNRDGGVVLAFFDGTEYAHGCNMGPETAMQVAKDLRRTADRLQEDDDE